MPLPGNNGAPKFDGTPIQLVPFFEIIEELGRIQEESYC
jgi:hypothetical protein